VKELRDLRAPGEDGARRRAWELTAAAAAERAAPRPRRRRRAAPLLAGAAATAALLAITPAGAAVTDWVGETVRAVVDADRPPARASGLEELPGGGRLLVLAAPRDGAPAAWIAGGGDHRRVAGAAAAATWSPHGRFVAVARHGELLAVDPRGDRRWSIPTPRPVREVRWSPDGFRVAYTAGAELRVVAGDGTGDRRVAAMRPGEPSAFGDLEWRPGGAAHVLAFVKRRSLFLADLDRRRVLWRVSVGDRPAIAFAPRGDRLLLTGRDGVRVLRARDGRTLRRRRGAGFGEAAWHPSGRRFAVVRRTAARAELLVGGPRRLRRVFAAGDLALAGFSPDGRWLLVDWTETGTWLFLPVDGGRPRQLTGVAGRFGARAVAIRGWCCSGNPDPK
jgi:dipeptidyl aminopeptidase/acylaminoacyl peptidase